MSADVLRHANGDDQAALEPSCNAAACETQDAPQLDCIVDAPHDCGASQPVGGISDNDADAADLAAWQDDEMLAAMMAQHDSTRKRSSCCGIWRRPSSSVQWRTSFPAACYADKT